MSSHDLTHEQGLQEYLEAHQSAPASVKLLSGGSANYVYRVTEQDGSTRILKHAEPYLHSNKDFTIDPTRMDYEAQILEALSPAKSPLLAALPGSNVHTVQLLSYDKTNKLLELDDGGSRNLKDAYTDPKLDIPHIGEQVGRWLVALHVFAKDLSLASPDEDRGVNNNPVAVDIYRYSYDGLHTALTQSGYNPQLADLINERFGGLLATEDECLCHGDFWPGNVLVQDFEQQPVRLTVVDWEMVRRGTSATDVGQFAAEAFLLDRFRGSKGLLSAFLIAYVTAREQTEALGKAWLTRMVVHWAVHIAFWPTRVQWSNEEETKMLVDVGVAILENVLNEDWDKVLESPLLKGVKERYATLLVRP
jgi:Ser/Thr protein kinase RdoA (MazF antagonist)